MGGGGGDAEEEIGREGGESRDMDTDDTNIWAENTKANNKKGNGVLEKNTTTGDRYINYTDKYNQELSKDRDKNFSICRRFKMKQQEIDVGSKGVKDKR